MQSVNLIDFFLKSGYIWKKDEATLEEICKFTKTRPKPEKTEFKFTGGHEQTFFIKALAEHIDAKNFFEIGTGRGTACYALSLIPDMQEILTVDIVPFEQKQNTAINFQPAHASNLDLYNMIPYKEKEKISFIQREELGPLLKESANKYDLCFIDGDHDNTNIIYEDFLICDKLMKEDGVIVFDDYHYTRFSVKEVVDSILKQYTDFNAYLVFSSGHLFNISNKIKDSGMVVVTRRNLSL